MPCASSLARKLQSLLIIPVDYETIQYRPGLFNAFANMELCIVPLLFLHLDKYVVACSLIYFSISDSDSDGITL